MTRIQFSLKNIENFVNRNVEYEYSLYLSAKTNLLWMDLLSSTSSSFKTKKNGSRAEISRERELCDNNAQRIG